jgi:RNA polymerase sigma-70 factor (ECF subfamily)
MRAGESVIAADMRLEFSDTYARHFADVVRWVRALGVPTVEVEDVAQEVFLVVQRKLPGFDGRNLRAWLYRIAARTASDYRRRFWFKHLFSRRSAAFPEKLESGDGAASERIADRQLLERILARMSEKKRVVFWLFEVEGYTGEEIAEVLGVPMSTVFTRLHHARRDAEAALATLGTKEVG